MVEFFRSFEFFILTVVIGYYIVDFIVSKIRERKMKKLMPKIQQDLKKCLEQSKKNGDKVFNIEVGQMPLDEARVFIEKIKQDQLKRIAKDSKNANL